MKIMLLTCAVALWLLPVPQKANCADKSTTTSAALNPFDQSQVPLEVEPPADFKGKKIVIVAGRQSHGPGDHEFFAGSAILMDLLKQSPGVWPVMARDGWPKNEKILEGAASLVFYMDGGGGHPVIKPDHMVKIPAVQSMALTTVRRKFSSAQLRWK